MNNKRRKGKLGGAGQFTFHVYDFNLSLVPNKRSEPSAVMLRMSSIYLHNVLYLIIIPSGAHQSLTFLGKSYLGIHFTAVSKTSLQQLLWGFWEVVWSFLKT